MGWGGGGGRRDGRPPGPAVNPCCPGPDPRIFHSRPSFSEFSGAHGILAACLVALKQVLPDNEVTLLGWIKFRVRVSRLGGGGRPLRRPRPAPSVGPPTYIHPAHRFCSTCRGCLSSPPRQSPPQRAPCSQPCPPLLPAPTAAGSTCDTPSPSRSRICGREEKGGWGVGVGVGRGSARGERQPHAAAHDARLRFARSHSARFRSQETHMPRTPTPNRAAATRLRRLRCPPFSPRPWHPPWTAPPACARAPCA